MGDVEEAGVVRGRSGDSRTGRTGRSFTFDLEANKDLVSTKVVPLRNEEEFLGRALGLVFSEVEVAVGLEEAEEPSSVFREEDFLVSLIL